MWRGYRVELGCFCVAAGWRDETGHSSITKRGVKGFKERCYVGSSGRRQASEAKGGPRPAEQTGVRRSWQVVVGCGKTRWAGGRGLQETQAHTPGPAPAPPPLIQSAGQGTREAPAAGPPRALPTQPANACKKARGGCVKVMASISVKEDQPRQFLWGVSINLGKLPLRAGWFGRERAQRGGGL
jgi:hypothetical protein